MNLLISIFFKSIVYAIIGTCVEVVFSAIKRRVVQGLNEKTEILEGTVSLWMLPVYAILLVGIFEPLYSVICLFPDWIRFFIWMIAFTLCEYLVGLFYHKVLNIRPWNYSDEPYNIHGYTKLTLLSWWGAFGLVIESIYSLLNYVSKLVIIFFT